MASYNTFSRQDKRRESLDLTHVELPNAYADRIFASLMHAINNGADPGKVQVLVGLLGTVKGVEIEEGADGGGNAIVVKTNTKKK